MGGEDGRSPLPALGLADTVLRAVFCFHITNKGRASLWRNGGFVTVNYICCPFTGQINIHRS